MTKILIAEDNKLSQKMMYYTFRRFGVDVYYADDGIMVDKMARADFYDIILMDIMMPGMSGYDATRHIRENEKLLSKKSIIIGLSGNVYDNEREKCISAGMDDFLSKPFDIDKLQAIVSRFGITL